MILLQLLFVVLLSTNVLTKPHRSTFENEKCGYQSCPVAKKDKLNIHLLPHSHDDVGWLKTVDQYYYGSKPNVQQAAVQYILDSVIKQLIQDENRKFIYVETSFLMKWWKEQNEEVRSQVKHLINNGQLEIINGAWSMNDEAVTHYQSIIDQFTWGLRALNDTFGECARPKIGWQIDPFGHSREMASIFSQLGYDGLFFGRLDFQDKQKRLKEKSMELIWRGSPNLGESSDLFTGALYNTYFAPSGFCFDILCGDDPIIDDKSSPEYNLDDRIQSFINICKEQAAGYKTNNVLITMGSDFTYQDAHKWYKNMDKLIYHINKRQDEGLTDVNIFYSTPSCYVKALHETNSTWPTKTDDFFPYGSDPHSYWTGFYTSRPTTKYFERRGNNILQMAKQFKYSEEDEDLNKLREAMGVWQHHDAITGTEKQHVTSDYERILSEAIKNIDDDLIKRIRKLSSLDSIVSDVITIDCAFNISQCNPTDNSQAFLLIIYNPSSHIVDKYIRIPVSGENYNVYDIDNNIVPSQVIPLSNGVLNIPGRNSTSKFDLVFLSTNNIPLGLQFYIVEPSNKEKSSSFMSKRIEEDTSIVENQYVRIISQNYGRKLTFNSKNDSLNITQEYAYYEGAEGDNHNDESRSSGAYIFRPTSSAITLEPTSAIIYEGPLVKEIHQNVTSWLTSVVSIYDNKKLVEVNWIVGPIPIGDGKGKEIITKYKTNLKTGGIFYTDSNGRELIRRERNHRETWDLDLKESIAGNYYPITSRIVLTENKNNSRVTVFTDRAQGGSSLVDGEIELMLHRRLLHDDAFGVGEALNETGIGQNGLVVRGTHSILSGINSKTSPTIVAEERKIAAQNILSPILFIEGLGSTTRSNIKNILEKLRENRYDYEGFIRHPLPDNLQILTLEPWKGKNTVLLRLEHILEANDDPVLSQQTCINIENLFSSLNITDIRETTLGANQWIEDNVRLKWKSSFSRNATKKTTYLKDENDYKVVNYYECVGNNSRYDIILSPMQIRTFIIHVK